MVNSTGTIRINNHNNWPMTEAFPCEKMLLDRLSSQNAQQIFLTSSLVADDSDEAFNATVSHILDSLDCLPMRPDAAFDSLYKIIDQNLDLFSVSGKSRMTSLVDRLFASAQPEWTAISEKLSASIPQQTADYAASRMLECFVSPNPPHSDRMISRAERSLTRERYAEFCGKFLVHGGSAANTPTLPYSNKRNAGRLMRLMFTKMLPPGQSSVQTGTPTAASILDLSVANNRLSASCKLHSLLEICLSTYRHERAHGESFSPFRSSKATLKTYAHAYYLLSVAYVIVLGILNLQGKGGVTISDVSNLTDSSMLRLSTIFSEAMHE